MPRPCGALQWMSRLELQDVLIQAVGEAFSKRRSCPAHHPPVFQWCLEQGADLLLTVKSNQKTLCRQIGSQFKGKSHIPYAAADQEEKHCRDTLLELRAREAPEHIKTNCTTTRHLSVRQQHPPHPRRAAAPDPTAS